LVLNDNSLSKVVIATDDSDSLSGGSGDLEILPGFAGAAMDASVSFFLFFSSLLSYPMD
jgi:hypothetical protein